MAYRNKPVEYDPRDVRERIDEENTVIWAHRFANKERAQVVALREEMQEHERRAAKLREEINGYFLPGQATAGTGNELAPDDAEMSDRLRAEPAITDVDAIRRTASLHRLEALAKADAFALGIEMAESMKARNVMETCMLHQMGAAHALAMRLMSKANTSVYQVADWIPVPKQQAETANAARLSNSAARLMEAYSRGMEALHKLRGGSPQQFVVQYVHVDGHGQAVINGNANTGGRGRRSDR